MNNKKTVVGRRKRKSLNKAQIFTANLSHTGHEGSNSHPNNVLKNCKRNQQTAKLSNIQAIDKVQQVSNSVTTEVLAELCEKLNSSQYNCNGAPRLEDDSNFQTCEIFDNDSGLRNEITCDQNSMSETFCSGSLSKTNVNGTDSGNEVITAQNDTSETICSRPTNETPINEKNSSPSKINPTDTAFVQGTNKSLPCLTSGNIQESSVSKPKNNAGKNPRKKAKLNLSDPTRRSTRRRTAPLATWRNQRSIYQLNDSGDYLFVGIYEGLKKSETLPSAVNDLSEKEVKDPKRKYKGKHCSEIDHIVVLDQRKNAPICAEVVQSYETLSWTGFCNSTSEEENYRIAKSFDLKQISFGFLELFSFEVKPQQCSPGRNIYYSIVFGAVKVKLNGSSFFAHLNDSFIVPSGNKYEITNILGKKTTLMFCLFKQPILKDLL